MYCLGKKIYTVKCQPIKVITIKSMDLSYKIPLHCPCILIRFIFLCVSIYVLPFCFNGVL